MYIIELAPLWFGWREFVKNKELDFTMEIEEAFQFKTHEDADTFAKASNLGNFEDYKIFDTDVVMAKF